MGTATAVRASLKEEKREVMNVSPVEIADSRVVSHQVNQLHISCKRLQIGFLPKNK
jgi:hypothetical protein